MNTALRAGVVGVGSLGQHHARIYSEMPGVDLVGVVDSDRDRAEEIAARHGCRVFADVEALGTEVDLASVATPTSTHRVVAEVLLDAGVAALVEKPLAADIEQGRSLVALAAARGAPLMVGHTERFNPAVSALLEHTEDPRFIEIHRLAPFVPRSLDVDVILDLMIHDLDLCRVLLSGAEVQSFDASGTAALTERIDIASVRLRFAGGAAANLTASRISQERIRRVRVFETGAFHACDTVSGTARSFRVQRDPDAPPRIVGRDLDLPPGEPLGRELTAFCRAVASGGSVPVPGEDGLAAVELALEIRDDIESQLSRYRAGGNSAR
ncbi:MAG TPA: Gfo/Idh/MocA family oxidoreductase [Acidobacteria bacterium]|nr:Gfo/Idh/MocA family oxidoreductase [Acidobacteriota bacterium]